TLRKKSMIPRKCKSMDMRLSVGGCHAERSAAEPKHLLSAHLCKIEPCLIYNQMLRLRCAPLSMTQSMELSPQSSNTAHKHRPTLASLSIPARKLPAQTSGAQLRASLPHSILRPAPSFA